MTDSEFRLALFLSVLAGMLLWERVSAVRPPASGDWSRRGTNALLALGGVAVARVTMPTGLAAAAWIANQRHLGLLHIVPVSPSIGWVASVTTLDLAIYAQHRAFHSVPVLWRLHSVHHADRGFDVTTGVRFHPVEILLSLIWKSSIVIGLGAPVGAVLLFELILSSTALFNHGNVRLPDRVEAWARLLLVTPTLHRIHHSLVREERDRNYGFSVTLWDRLFGTFLPAAAEPDQTIGFGLPGVAANRARSIAAMLLLPFRAPGAE